MPGPSAAPSPKEPHGCSSTAWFFPHCKELITRPCIVPFLLSLYWFHSPQPLQVSRAEPGLPGWRECQHPSSHGPGPPSCSPPGAQLGCLEEDPAPFRMTVCLALLVYFTGWEQNHPNQRNVLGRAIPVLFLPGGTSSQSHCRHHPCGWTLSLLPGCHTLGSLSSSLCSHSYPFKLWLSLEQERSQRKAGLSGGRLGVSGALGTIPGMALRSAVPLLGSSGS